MSYQIPTLQDTTPSGPSLQVQNPWSQTAQTLVVVRDPAQIASKPARTYTDLEFTFWSRYAALRYPSRSDPPHSLRSLPAAGLETWGRVLRFGAGVASGPRHGT